jgi:hypothetical protein
MVVLPKWISQVPELDFAHETKLLEDFEGWAQRKGWIVSDGSSLPLELRERTDVLLELPGSQQRIRIAVLPKSRRGVGAIRLDASNLRTVELIYRPRQKRWRVEIAGVPLEDDLLDHGWEPLIKLMFRA